MAAAAPQPPPINDGETLNDYAARVKMEHMQANGFDCFQAFVNTVRQNELLPYLVSEGGKGVWDNYQGGSTQSLGSLYEMGRMGGREGGITVVNALDAALIKINERYGATMSAGNEDANPQCRDVWKTLTDNLSSVYEGVNEALTGTVNNRKRKPGAALKYLHQVLSKIPPIYVQLTPRTRVTVAERMDMLEVDAEKYANRAKRAAARELKGTDISPEQLQRNKLCVASISYSALQTASIAAPTLFRNSVLWDSEGLPGTDVNTRINLILASHPEHTRAKPYEDDVYTDDPWLYSGLLIRLLSEWTAKYVGGARGGFSGYMPGYLAYMKPTIKEIGAQRMYGLANFLDVFQARPGIRTGVGVAARGGQVPSEEGINFMENMLRKGTSLETQCLLAAMYSMPTPNVVSVDDTTIVRRPPDRWFNNAMTKGRFQALSSAPGGGEPVPECNTLARLLDMGGDSCPTTKQLVAAGDARLNQEQSYPILIRSREAQSKVDIIFSGGRVTVEIDLGQRVGGGVGDAPWPVPTDEFERTLIPHKLNLTADMTNQNLVDINASIFAKSGAAGNIAAKLVGGLVTAKQVPKFNTQSTPSNRYGLYLNNADWVGAVVGASLAKWVGDYARLLEGFTRYTVAGVPVDSSALLANNDRPAQAAAILMTTALGSDALTPSACYYASDLNNIKKDPDIDKATKDYDNAKQTLKAVKGQGAASVAAAKAEVERLRVVRDDLLATHIMAIWTLAPDAVRSGVYTDRGANIGRLTGPLNGRHIDPVRGANAIPGSGLATCLLSGVDTLHDMTPGAEHMTDMVSKLGKATEMLSGGAKQKGGAIIQRGGVGEHPADRLRAEIKELIATEAMMTLADSVLMANGPASGIMECFRFPVPGYDDDNLVFVSVDEWDIVSNLIAEGTEVGPDYGMRIVVCDMLKDKLYVMRRSTMQVGELSDVIQGYTNGSEHWMEWEDAADIMGEDGGVIVVPACDLAEDGSCDMREFDRLQALSDPKTLIELIRGRLKANVSNSEEAEENDEVYARQDADESRAEEPNDYRFPERYHDIESHDTNVDTIINLFSDDKKLQEWFITLTAHIESYSEVIRYALTEEELYVDAPGELTAEILRNWLDFVDTFSAEGPPIEPDVEPAAAVAHERAVVPKVSDMELEESSAGGDTGHVPPKKEDLPYINIEALDARTARGYGELTPAEMRAGPGAAAASVLDAHEAAWRKGRFPRWGNPAGGEENPAGGDMDVESSFGGRRRHRTMRKRRKHTASKGRTHRAKRAGKPSKPRAQRRKPRKAYKSRTRTKSKSKAVPRRRRAINRRSRPAKK
jgi:hypothetical protein